MKIENKNYKDSVFRFLFNDKARLLELYNAINGTTYNNPEDLEIRTLKGNTFLNVRNDTSFIIEFNLNLYEHQSTPFPNIPLRDLYYVASMYMEIISLKKTYGPSKGEIPSPRFFVFYNGMKDMPDQATYKLSDMYSVKDTNPSLELIVTAYNVNEGHNKELMEACKTLKNYSIFVSKVRKYNQQVEAEYNATHLEPLEILVDKASIKNELLSHAVSLAIDECISEDILPDFFREYRQEVIDMSISEYISDELAEVYNEDGRIAERQNINTLNTWLFDLDRVDDVKRAAIDPSVMEALIQEYNECHEEKLK